MIKYLFFYFNIKLYNNTLIILKDKAIIISFFISPLFKINIE